MKKVVLLDRDGIINHDSLHYIKSPEEFIPLPGSLEAIAQLTEAGYRLGIATNQSGISRNLYTEQLLGKIHDKLLGLVEDRGGKIDAIEFCPHLPDTNCDCRKPQPGMLFKLAARLECNLNDVCFIGDRVSDIEAAYAAGAKPIMIVSPMTDKAGLLSYPEVPVFHSLNEWVNFFLADVTV